MLRWLPALVLAFLLVPAPPALAHDATTTAHATLTGSGPSARVVLDLEYDLLMKSAWLYAEAYEARDRPSQLRQLTINRAAVLSYVNDRFAVVSGGKRCAAVQTGDADVRLRGQKAFAVLTLDFTCAGAAPREISSALFPDAESFVHGTQTLVGYTWDGLRGSAVLTAASPTLSLAEHRPSAQVGEFFLLGAEHLLLGLDHIFFLLALLIGARRLRDVVVTSTAFTAAHSLTFLLAALGVVDVPSAVVEPVIALSIVIVAVANLLGRGEDRLGRWRLPIVFTFGLIHGLGFAGALDIRARGSWDLLLSLLSFNVGIEAAQLAIIAVVFPLLTLARRRSWVPMALSIPIVGMSLYWLIDRI